MNTLAEFKPLQTNIEDPIDQLFVVPGFSFLAVSQSCLCYNRKTQSFLNTVLNKAGRTPCIQTTYKHVLIRKPLRVLIALTFVKEIPAGYSLPDDLAMMDVIHIDGNIRNMSPSNLRWFVKHDTDFMLSENADENTRLHIVPSFPLIAVNRKGQCYSLKSNKILTDIYREGESIQVRIHLDGKNKYLTIRRLLAEVFIKEYPIGFTISDIADLAIIHKDGDINNIKIENLKWVANGELSFLFMLDNYTDEDTRYYQVPSIPHLAINRSGDVLSLVYGELLSKNPQKASGYVQIQTKYKGKFISKRHHRLLGEVFISPPTGYTLDQCLNELEINHKNGIRSDNRLTNLEWVTSQGNTLHAIHTGLIPNIRRFITLDIDENIKRLVYGESELFRLIEIKSAIIASCFKTGLFNQMVFNNFSIRLESEMQVLPHLTRMDIDNSREPYFKLRGKGNAYELLVTSVVCLEIFNIPQEWLDNLSEDFESFGFFKVAKYGSD